MSTARLHACFLPSSFWRLFVRKKCIQRDQKVRNVDMNSFHVYFLLFNTASVQNAC